jgi:hypothetical protein
MIMPNERPKFDRAMLGRLRDALGQDMLSPGTPMETVRTTLRAAGIDPTLVQQDAVSLLNEIHGGISVRTADSVARARLSDRRSRPPALRLRRMTRAELVARVNALRSTPIAMGVAHQLQRPISEEATEEELRNILEELEAMFAADDDVKEPK